MRYGDLLQFEPIESVIQLLDANRPDDAKRLVSSYVFSDELADRLTKIVFPQLSFDEGVDHKGLLVVGNYGTGKSHLMSVLSLLAEDPAYGELLKNPKVAEAAKVITGKFKVHRIEISSQMSLRELVTQQLEVLLTRLDLAYSFPPADKVVNNKAAFEEMMAVFEERYPDQGILLVVDEFLEYLRSRKDHDLVLDLSFLRELGEVTKNLRFRFLAGVQESIFDSSRFQHVSDSLRRVNERFAQFLLVRQDVSFVIAERLLKKTASQQQQIRQHLAGFTKFYGQMNERLDDYVRLFPVHPDYLGTFEQLVFTEKRGALVTLRDQIQALLDQEVPKDQPGLLGYDRFWETILSNKVLQADPAISPVLKVSEVLSERVQKAFTRPQYKALALRVIHGLSVHRLTTGGDIYVPVGPTTQELRDSLCLFQPGIGGLGGDPAEDLLTAVQTTLREILKTVNGQFLSKAPDTDQYFLDLKKDIDYEAQVEKRAETLSDEALDRAYFSAIKQLMERTDESIYVPGHHIWQYQLEWQEHRVERGGYLFFGAPNDRPTAQPERDFYVYFVQPYEPPKFKDEQKADEVFFRLKGLDTDFRQALATYAGAQDLASTASGSAKNIYLDKAKEALRSMSRWLQEKQTTAFEVTCQGKAQTLQDWSKGVSIRDRLRLAPDQRANFRDIVNVISGLALKQHFEDLAPEYPKFSLLLTDQNRASAVGSALKVLAGRPRTKEALSVLDALELLDGDRLDPSHSKYAQEVLTKLKAKGAGQVLNRSELLVGSVDLSYFVPHKYRLEPDLLVPVLGALVYSGDLVLALTGDKLDSSKCSQLADRNLDDLTAFKHLEAPKELNLALLRSLFETLGLSPGLATLASQGNDEAVKQLQEGATQWGKRALEVDAELRQGLSLWGKPLLAEAEVKAWRASLEQLQKFTETLAPYNSLGKLKNLRVTFDELKAVEPAQKILEKAENLRQLVTKLGPLAQYLALAEKALDPAHPWVGQAATARSQTFLALESSPPPALAELLRPLEELKKSFRTEYVNLHAQARLGVAEDKAKTRLLKDPRLMTLRTLAAVPLLPTNQLQAFEDQLGSLKSCASLLEDDLSAAPECPHCNFRPSDRQGNLISVTQLLKTLDDQLDRLVVSWQSTLLDTLEDPTLKENLNLLLPDAQGLLKDFLASRTLPEPLTGAFVAALQEALSGLEKVSLAADELLAALRLTGAPARVEDLRSRFDAFLRERCKGKDAEKLRVLFD